VAAREAGDTDEERSNDPAPASLARRVTGALTPRFAPLHAGLYAVACIAGL